MDLLEGPGDSPSVRFFVLVVQWFYLLLFLGATETRRVGESEEVGRELHEPLGVDGGHLTHVLLRREHELVVDDPAMADDVSRTGVKP